MIQVIRIENGVRKTVTIQKNIWKNIVDGAQLPEGVTYELAPEPKAIELMAAEMPATAEDDFREEEIVEVKKPSKRK